MQISKRPDLIDALLALDSRAEAESFLADLCTPSEMKAFAERWAIARPLGWGRAFLPRNRRTGGLGTATVVRVARFLKEMPHQGYRLVLDRLKRRK